MKGTPHQGWFTQNKGDFTEATDVPTFLTWPLIATGTYQSMGHLNPEQYNLHLRVSNHDITLKANDINNSVKFNNCKLTVDDNRILTIINEQNPEPFMEITGENGKFISKNGAEIVMPQDFVLWIKEDASVEPNGTSFESDNEFTYWKSIALEDHGTTTFDNCEFKNAYCPINTYNTLLNYLTISNCIFRNIEFRAMDIKKAYNVFISNNDFRLGAHDPEYCDGIAIYQPANSEGDNNIGIGYNINIIGNSFYGGRVQILCGATNELLPVYVYNNIFNNGQQNLSFINCTGSIINNNINSTLTYINAETYCYGSYWSSPDFLDNNFIGNYNNIELIDLNCPNLAFLEAGDGTLIWIAGRNGLTSLNNYNIRTRSQLGQNYFITDKGVNSFSINNQSMYHFGAFLNTESYDYNSTNNCWYITGSFHAPQYWLINLKPPPQNEMTLHYIPVNPACVFLFDQIVDRIITDRGFGIYDTILITQSNNTPPPSSDVALYSIGVKNQKLKNYGNAILNFKNLINNYSSSKHLERSIFNLYECYVSSDTNHNQGWRNVIFGDLKSFLESKIQQYENNEVFVNLAFDFYLKCKVKIKSYQPAMYGYEFIAENSPSSTERLMASLSYIDVEGLLQGSGSG